MNRYRGTSGMRARVSWVTPLWIGPYDQAQPLQASAQCYSLLIEPSCMKNLEESWLGSFAFGCHSGNCEHQGIRRGEPLKGLLWLLS